LKNKSFHNYCSKGLAVNYKLTKNYQSHPFMFIHG